MSAAAVGLLGASVLAGAGTQRLTGLGFALVASPFLVLVAGPHNGVLLANILSLATNLVVLAIMRRHVDLRRALTLAVPALCLVPVGAWVARQLPTAALYLVIGGLVLAALSVVTFIHGIRLSAGLGGAATAGAVSGFMNVTAGVGGPAITLYAVSTDWEHTEFVGTIQLYFALLNAGSITAKGGFPSLTPTEIAVCLVALALGTVGGQLLNKHVPIHRARQAILVLAFAGGLATVIKGATGL